MAQPTVKAIEFLSEKLGHLQAFLFDMDGVLYDSMPHHAIAWKKAMDDIGLSITEEDVYMNEGRTGLSTINLFAEGQWCRTVEAQEAERIYSLKASYFNSMQPVRPMPGARELLNSIKNQGIQIVLVTGSGQTSLLERLERDFPCIFQEEKMVTSADVKFGKPHPEPYLMALKKIGIDASEAIVVENAPLGIRAARAAGISTIALNTGPLDDNVLWQEDPTFLFSSLQDFLKAWQEVVTKRSLIE